MPRGAFKRESWQRMLWLLISVIPYYTISCTYPTPMNVLPRGSKNISVGVSMALPRNNCSTCRYKISENKSSEPLKTHQHLTAKTLTNAIKIPRYDKAVRDLYLTVSWGLLDLNVDVEGLEGDGNGMLPVLVTYYYVW